jgi:hypothetical protein
VFERNKSNGSQVGAPTFAASAGTISKRYVMRYLSNSAEIENQPIRSDLREQTIFRAIEESGSGLGLTPDQVESIERVVQVERAAFSRLLERVHRGTANSQAVNRNLLSLGPRTINDHILIMVEMLIVTKRIKILVDHLLTAEQRSKLVRRRREYVSLRENRSAITDNKGQFSIQ